MGPQSLLFCHRVGLATCRRPPQQGFSADRLPSASREEQELELFLLWAVCIQRSSLRFPSAGLTEGRSGGYVEP
jgi:hypothetical protein